MKPSTLLASLSFTVLFPLLTTTAAYATTNIDPAFVGKKFGWSENGGWTNLQGDLANGVHVGLAHLQGFAWHENFGWINFGSGNLAEEQQYTNATRDDFGVNIDTEGKLFGFAWGENIGWISFDTLAASGARVSIVSATGRFTGHAWSENVGWISFDTVDPLHVAHTLSDTAANDWNLFE